MIEQEARSDLPIELEARSIVEGQRRQQYGEPAENHSRTELLWNSYLYAKYNIDIPFTLEDICYLNILQKISRDMNSPQRDNLVDQIGFLLNIDTLRNP